MGSVRRLRTSRGASLRVPNLNDWESGLGARFEPTLRTTTNTRHVHPNLGAGVSKPPVDRPNLAAADLHRLRMRAKQCDQRLVSSAISRRKVGDFLALQAEISIRGVGRPACHARNSTAPSRFTSLSSRVIGRLARAIVRCAPLRASSLRLIVAALPFNRPGPLSGGARQPGLRPSGSSELPDGPTSSASFRRGSAPRVRLPPVRRG